MLRLLTLIGLMCLINTAVVAQDLEIGAFYGQRFGGTIGTATFGGSEITDLDVSEGDAWGMTVEFTLPNSWRMEFIWDSQDSYLNGNLDGTGKTRLASTTVNNYLFGGNYYFSQDAFRPFIGFHLGATAFDTQGLDSKTRFAYSLGGGAKYALTENVILDARLRWIATYIDGSGAMYCSLPGSCYIASAGDYMNQFNLSLGLNFRL